jgi:DNA-binding NarL/FixJ family response regulator
LAESVSAPLVILVARASNVQPPDDPAGFLVGLVQAGVLVRDGTDPAGKVFRLRPEVQHSLLADLERWPGGCGEVRARLVRYGLVSAPLSLIGQLAVWAFQDSDWGALSVLWLQYPPAIWASVGPNGVAVFSSIPLEACEGWPALTQAAAMSAALNDSEARTFSEQARQRLRQDGWVLHAGWRDLKNVDSALRAGSMWMVAQRTLAGSADDLDNAWATHLSLEAFIREQARAGNPTTAKARTFFHAMSAETALLRGDVSGARLESEEAMALGQPGDISSLIGAGLQALTQQLLGDVHGFEIAANWFAANALACGAFAAVATPYLELALALASVRLLDRDAAQIALQGASAMEQKSEFWSLHAWITSLIDLTWDEADVGLARLEATVSRNPPSVGHETLSDTFEVRARTELLCGAGRVNQDNALLKAHARSKLSRYHLASEARMHLCSHDGASAVRLAERGIHDATFTLPDRAHLSTIKAAGLLAVGAERHLILEALRVACALCTEAASLLPFVFLPADLRAGLLALYDTSEHNPGCLLARPSMRARLDGVMDNFEYSPALIRLTPREETLLPLLATPATIDNIARQLHVSGNTLRKQVVTLRRKLGAANRRDMIDTAYELGLLADRRQSGTTPGVAP